MKTRTLSEAQLALIPQVWDEWIKTGRDTAAVDRAKVREILCRLYAVADKSAPPHILHFDSPLQISIAVALLRQEGRNMRHQLADPINGEVHEALRDKFTCQMNEQVSSAVNAQIRQYIRRQLPERRTHETFSDFRRAAYARNMQVIEQIHEQIHENVRNMFRSLRAWTFRDDFGQFDMLLARYDFLGRLGIDVSKLVPSFDLAKSCGAAALFWDWAFIGAKPEYIHCNEQGRVHCETGPAIRYYDGFSIFAIHGVRVPEKVVVSPDTITVAEINLETNVEMRRVMLERYGVERYLMDSGAVEIHRDDFGILYRQQLPRDEPLVMVKVVNATPEPDGSFKDYFLRVPPTMERAIQAVAWTFGKEENDYTPELQT